MKELQIIQIAVDEHVHDLHIGMNLFLVDAKDKLYDDQPFTTGFRVDRFQNQGMFDTGLSEPMQIITEEDDGWHFSMCMMGELDKAGISELIKNGKLETERFKLEVASPFSFNGTRFMTIDECQKCKDFCLLVHKETPPKSTCDKCMGNDSFPRV